MICSQELILPIVFHYFPRAYMCLSYHDVWCIYMAVSLTIILHLKPVDEIDTSKPLPQAIREYAYDIYDSLHKVADSIEKLINNGWECELHTYEVQCIKDVYEIEAKRELKQLGLEELIPNLQLILPEEN